MVNINTVLRSIFTFFVIFTLLHTLFYFFVYKEGISVISERGLSGTAIGDKNFRDELSSISSKFGSSLSRTFVLLEWVFILIASLIILTILLRKRISAKKVTEFSSIRKESIKEGYITTDLDDLYDLLKEKKILQLSSICKLYGVGKEAAMGWGKMLELDNLIRIEYPFLGEPKFIYSEKLGIVKDVNNS